MKPAEKATLRNSFYKETETINVEGFEYLGQVVEGALFQDTNGQCVTIKCIVKNEDFDFNDALDEFEEKELSKILREKERAEKKAKALAEKAKKEAEKAKKAEVVETEAEVVEFEIETE
jgi:hypothetical protein